MVMTPPSQGPEDQHAATGNIFGRVVMQRVAVQAVPVEIRAISSGTPSRRPMSSASWCVYSSKLSTHRSTARRSPEKGWGDLLSPAAT